jgi:hypothetical protein
LSRPRDDDFELDPDELPATHLDDEAYDAFVESEFASDGRLKGDPPVVWIVVGIVVVLLALLSLLV